MKLRLPNYYKNFKCIADKCKDSCCSAGWEIDIDDKTAEFYKNVKGNFGDKLRKNIKFGYETMKSDECSPNNSNTSHFILNNNNQCPFFNKNGLCDIYTNLGENSLCQICTEHPRYYEWFDNLKEGGIGLCCEEAARIIMCNDNSFETFEIDIPYEDCNDYNVEIFDYLSLARSKIIDYISDNSITLFSQIGNILWYCYMIQQDLDCELLDDEDIICLDFAQNAFNSNVFATDFFNKTLQFFSTMDINDENWLYLLKKCQNLNVSEKSFNEFMNSRPEINLYLKNIYVYFIWRYFMKGCFDNEILSKVKLATISIIVINYLWYCKWLDSGKISFDDMIDITKKYSEEIEYCEENLFKLAQASYDFDIFSIDNLLKICGC